MLRELHISNLAVISDVRIELDRGLNCFTGATGAGKSLIIGALGVLLGTRNTADLLRPGADEGRVSGLFEISDGRFLLEIERLSDVPLKADGGELLITRKLHASGRTSVTLNGNPVTLGMLKQLGELLVDVHGQHDHEYLLKPSNQIEVLDQFGSLAKQADDYRDAFAALNDARRALADLAMGRDLRAQRIELLRFQVKEIDAAELDPAEYAELESRSSVLQNLEKLKKNAGAAYASLYEVEGSTLERLKMSAAVLQELAGIDANVKPIADGVKSAAIQLEDSVYDLSKYLDKLDIDPAELVEVADRLNIINRILSKYGGSVEAVLQFRAQVGEQLSQLERQSDDLSSLTAALSPLRKRLAEAGKALTAARLAAALNLAPRVEASLAELGMEKAKFTIGFSPAEGAIAGEELPAAPSGFDQVEFIIQTNPGQLAQPLRKIASGGELSRIMLALKGILAGGERMSVLVFDEIDANVGGRLGSIIGNKLRSLSAKHQVLCITHLPQIASYADRHFTVRKEVSRGKTESQVRVLVDGDRIQELAEMIGGTRITETTLAQARELVETAAADRRIKPVGMNGKAKKPKAAAR
jgi:DNA repair protein RecN (Recombination protein N)